LIYGSVGWRFFRSLRKEEEVMVMNQVFRARMRRL
jgi:hypothetical protein